MKKFFLLVILLLLCSLPVPSLAAEAAPILLTPGSYEAGSDLSTGNWTVLPAEGEVIIVTLNQHGKEYSTVVTGFGYHFFHGSDIVPALDVTLSAGCQITIAGGAAQLILNDEVMVWVSKSGKRYHRLSDCSNMQSPQRITEAEAVASGKTPCSNCWD